MDPSIVVVPGFQEALDIFVDIDIVVEALAQLVDLRAVDLVLGQHLVLNKVQDFDPMTDMVIGLVMDSPFANKLEIKIIT